MTTKQSFDKNMQTVFNLVNLPTKSDYEKLFRKLDSMNKSVAGLESRIDELSAMSESLAQSGEKIANAVNKAEKK